MSAKIRVGGPMPGRVWVEATYEGRVVGEVALAEFPDVASGLRHARRIVDELGAAAIQPDGRLGPWRVEAGPGQWQLLVPDDRHPTGWRSIAYASCELGREGASAQTFVRELCRLALAWLDSVRRGAS